MEQSYVEQIKALALDPAVAEASIDKIIKDGGVKKEKKDFETVDAIAEYLGLTHETVDRIIGEVGAKTEKKYFETQDEVAEYLGLTHATINRLIKTGEIKGERVGVGEKRTHFKFSVDELDRYQIVRMRKKLGKKFDGELMEANLVGSFFRGLNTDLVIGEMLKGKEFEEAMKDSCFKSHDFDLENLESLCPLERKEQFKTTISLYKKLQKDVRAWIHNQLICSPIITQVVHRPSQGQELSDRDKKANEIYLRFNIENCLILTVNPVFLSPTKKSDSK